MAFGIGLLLAGLILYVMRRRLPTITSKGRAGEEQLHALIRKYPHTVNLVVYGPRGNSEIDVLLQTEHGYLILETKAWSGTVEVSPQGWLRRFGYTLQPVDPVVQLQVQEAGLRTKLARLGFAAKEIQSAIVMTDYRLNMLGKDGRRPILWLDQVHAFIGPIPERTEAAWRNMPKCPLCRE